MSSYVGVPVSVFLKTEKSKVGLDNSEEKNLPCEANALDGQIGKRAKITAPSCCTVLSPNL